MVELNQAFSWYCPDCDELNFCLALLAEMSEEEMSDLKEEFGVEPWETGDFVMKPEKVTCKGCGHTHSTHIYEDSEPGFDTGAGGA